MTTTPKVAPETPQSRVADWHSACTAIPQPRTTRRPPRATRWVPHTERGTRDATEPRRSLAQRMHCNPRTPHHSADPQGNTLGPTHRGWHQRRHRATPLTGTAHAPRCKVLRFRISATKSSCGVKRLRHIYLKHSTNHLYAVSLNHLVFYSITKRACSLATMTSLL